MRLTVIFVTNYLQYFDFNPAVVFCFRKAPTFFNAFNIAYDGYMHDKDDIQNSVNMYNLIGVCGESYVSSKPALLTTEDFIAESGFDFYKTKHIFNKYRLFAISEITQNFNNGA